MTSQSPRIYTYKITFEEVPYYYYGSKKEKWYNQEYWGSPIANKWCWELYTPKKQILEFFEFSDDGYEECRRVEDRLIKPVYQTDKWCLNESCGGMISLDIRRKTGKKVGKKNYEEKKGFHAETTEQKRKRGQKLYKDRKGIHAQTFEERSELGKRNGQKLYKEGKGIHSQTIEERKEYGRKTGKNHFENKTGCFSITPKERREINKKTNEKLLKEGKGIFSLTDKERKELGEKTSSQKWICLETGYVSTPGGLSSYQKARGIDTSKRKRIA